MSARKFATDIKFRKGERIMISTAFINLERWMDEKTIQSGFCPLSV